MNHVTHPFSSADISIFRSSSLFQSNCIYKSNEQVTQATCFYFHEMSWLLTEHKGQVLKAGVRVPYNRIAGRVLVKSNKLVFFSFGIVPKYIYLDSVRRKHCLNPMRLALCLAMGSDRIIAKQGNSLLGLSLNKYVMTQIIYVYHLHQSQYFILKHFLFLYISFEKLLYHYSIWDTYFVLSFQVHSFLFK